MKATLLFFFLVLGFLCPAMAEPVAKWAVYWYLCGSDLESGGGCASADLKEAMQASFSPDVRVIVYADGAKRWQLPELPKGKGAYFEIRQGKLHLLKSQRRRNMGEPETLADFLRFCRQECPAERTMLLFWNHGGGSCHGLAFDECFDGDCLSLEEIQEALSSVYELNMDKPPLTMVAFDTCLMGTVENAYAMAGYASYMLASQDVEPGTGWAYDAFLSELGRRPSMKPQELGRIICDSYMKSCRRISADRQATLAMLDLQYAPLLRAVMDMGALELMDEAEDELLERISELGRCARRAENYGGNTASSGYSNMVDMMSFFSRAKKWMPGAEELLAELMKKSVVYKRNGDQRQGCGLSFYYPLSGSKADYHRILSSAAASSGMSFLYGLLLDEKEKTLERLAGEMEESLRQAQELWGAEDGEDAAEGEEEGSDASALAEKEDAEDDGEESGSSGSSVFSEALAGGSQGGGGGFASAVAALGSVDFPYVAAGGLPDWSAVQQEIGQVAGQVSSMQQHCSASQFDISGLEDCPVKISEEGEAYVETGELRRRLESVSALVLLLSKTEEGELLMVNLGDSARIKEDWKEGRFADCFDGKWLCLNGEPLMLELSSQEGDFVNFRSPVRLNGEEAVLEIVYDCRLDHYELLGARKRTGENGCVDRTLRLLRPGDKLELLSYLFVEDGAPQEFEMETLTIGKKTELKRQHLGDGDYALAFQFSNARQESSTSEPVFFHVEEGEITVSDTVDIDELE